MSKTRKKKFLFRLKVKGIFYVTSKGEVTKKKMDSDPSNWKEKVFQL